MTDHDRPPFAAPGDPNGAKMPDAIADCMNIIHQHWYDPTVDTGGWAFFKKHIAFAGLTVHEPKAVIAAVEASLAQPDGVDSGMWHQRIANYKDFVASWKSVTNFDPPTLASLQLAVLDCLLNGYERAAHNEGLWKAVNDAAAVGVAEARNWFYEAYPPTAELTTPSNPIATDSESWGPSSVIEQLTFTNPPDSGLWDNFYDTVWPTRIEMWHPQHVVRLPNKDGRAYFVVSQSRSHNGYITVLESDPGALDPDTDLIVTTGPNTSIGKYIWQDVFTGSYNGHINYVGNWNHPGKMGHLGGVLVVAAQNYMSDDGGKSTDSVLFYDVRDPAQPWYWGAINAHELGVKEVAVVGLVRTPDGGYLLCAGGDETYATLWAQEISPNLKDWTRLDPNDPSFATQHVFSGQHGMDFNSYQKTTTISEKSPPNGVERVMYFDASSSGFSFTGYVSDATTRMLMRTGKRKYSRDLPGADRDWDTSSLYVTPKGVPIVYTVKSGDWPPYKLYQVHNET